MECLSLVALLCLGAIEADPAFKAGQRHVDDFEFEQASALFEALAKRPDLAAPDRAQVLVWLGISYAELRDEARAAVAFEDAVSADPLVVLPRDRSPKIKALLEDARARVRLRTQAAPPKTPPQTPPPAPTPTSDAGPVENGGGGLFPIALATTIAGGAVALGGGAIWGVGLALRQQAVDAKFQSDAATLRDQSLTAQLVGQVSAGIGVAVLIAGGALLAVSAAE